MTRDELRSKLEGILLEETRPPITWRQAEVIRDCVRILESEHYHIVAAKLRGVLAELEGRR